MTDSTPTPRVSDGGETREGDRMIWRAVVSNYGHTMRFPVVVERVTAKRVRVRRDLPDGRVAFHTVKPENLIRE